MPVNLTETAIRAAIRKAKEEGRLELVDAAFKGLRLRVSTKGVAKWVLACRDQAGRMRRFEVGTWSDKGGMGISDARTTAEALRVSVRKGADPTADRRRQRAQSKDAHVGVGTLGALLERYTKHDGKNIKSWLVSKRRIEIVFADLLKRPAAALTRQELQAAIDDYPSAQQARGAATALLPVLRWAERREIVSFELLRIHPPPKSNARERVLTSDELRALLPVLWNSGSSYAAAHLLILLTLTRRSEACDLTWGELDLARSLWVIPSSRAKNGVEHRIPLSRQARRFLEDRCPGRPDERVFATRNGRRLTNWDRATKLLMKESGTKDWTRHDLRRTGATLLGRMRVLPHVIEAALNHVHIESQVATIYNQARYEADVANALQMLADRLDGIEAGGADVVLLRTQAKA